MDRRTFLKSIGGVVAGITGFCLLPKKKEKFGWIAKPMGIRILNNAEITLPINTRPITEGEIGPIEDDSMKIWTENKCTVVVKETCRGIEKINLPEPAKALHIYFGRVMAICENATYGEEFKN